MADDNEWIELQTKGENPQGAKTQPTEASRGAETQYTVTESPQGAENKSTGILTANNIRRFFLAIIIIVLIVLAIYGINYINESGKTYYP